MLGDITTTIIVLSSDGDVFSTSPQDVGTGRTELAGVQIATC